MSSTSLLFLLCLLGLLGSLAAQSSSSTDSTTTTTTGTTTAAATETGTTTAAATETGTTTAGATETGTTTAETTTVATTTTTTELVSIYGPIDLTYSGLPLISKGFVGEPQNTNPGFLSAPLVKSMSVKTSKNIRLPYQLNFVVEKPWLGIEIEGLAASGTLTTTPTSFTIKATCAGDGEKEIQGVSWVHIWFDWPGTEYLGTHFFFTQICGEPFAEVPSSFTVKVGDMTLVDGGAVTSEYETPQTSMDTDSYVVQWSLNSRYQVGSFQLTSSHPRRVEPTSDLKDINSVQAPFIGYSPVAGVTSSSSSFTVNQPCSGSKPALITFEAKVAGYRTPVTGSYFRDCSSASALGQGFFLVLSALILVLLW